MDDGSGFNKDGHFRTHTTTTVCCKRKVTEHGRHAQHATVYRVNDTDRHTNAPLNPSLSFRFVFLLGLRLCLSLCTEHFLIFPSLAEHLEELLVA